MKLIGVDVGGTFTDVMYGDTETNKVAIHKIPTTPEDPSQGVIAGICDICLQADIERSKINHILHGTTIATNAVLEFKGARTGLITTSGYRDILHIGRHQRPQHYSIMQDIPWQYQPLVKRRYRKVVVERLTPPEGSILVPLDEEGVRNVAKELRDAKVEAIAICFLFSYLNPNHEKRAAEIVKEEYPECFVTTSSSVSPQFREFERFTTAAMNAFIGPKVSSYIDELHSSLSKNGFKADLHVMGSNGGVATSAMVAEHPIMTLLSGPAAGVLGGASSGQKSDRNRLITFDVGGTSADIGLVINGQFSEATARDTWIGGYPVVAPMIDIHTIGAGGGSIAHLDPGDAFRVGPKSAGAIPGPAAYGHGGNLPTVTDANVVLGRLQSTNFLGGEMDLDRTAAFKVIEKLGKQIGMSTEEAADGVLTIINANMANAIRSRTVQKGQDPREFSLVAFGGAGPLHGIDVARDLGIPEVIIPPYPGITSAAGLLTTDLKYDAIRTEFQTSGKVDLNRILIDFQTMHSNLEKQFEIDGISKSLVTYIRSGDLRYEGQGYELRVPISNEPINEQTLIDLFHSFEEIHKLEYGHLFTDNPIEIVNIRLTGTGKMPKVDLPLLKNKGTLNNALIDEVQCYFRVNGDLRPMNTPIYSREKLPIDQIFEGPSIVLQKDTTTIIPPGALGKAETCGNLIIQTGA